MKVFSKELFIKTHGFERYERSKEWVDKCDGLTIEEAAKNGFTLLADWLIENEDNNCLHCGKNSKKYCEKCYQELISENAKLQLQVDEKARLLKRLENVRLKGNANFRSIIREKEKIINKMAEQLAGLAVFDSYKDETIILGAKEEVIQYYKEMKV